MIFRHTITDRDTNPNILGTGTKGRLLKHSKLSTSCDEDPTPPSLTSRCAIPVAKIDRVSAVKQLAIMYTIQ